MKTRILTVLTVLFVLSFNTTFAQGCEDDVAAPGASGVPTTKSMTIFGYIQPQFTSQFTDPGTSTFDFKRARFGVRGRVNRSFSYYVVLETSAFVGGGDAYLLDAFVTYDKHEWAKFSLGSFKQPFGREVTTACHSLTTIDRAIVSDQIVAPQRDMGLMMLGGSSATKFRYSLALMNGKMITTASALTQLMRLHQITCGHFTANDGTTQEIKNNRIQELLDVLEEIEGKAIIWAHYQHDIKNIKKLFFIFRIFQSSDSHILNHRIIVASFVCKGSNNDKKVILL